MERVITASATEEGFGGYIFTMLKADEPCVEGKDVNAKSPNILCNDVEEMNVVMKPPVSFYQKILVGFSMFFVAARLTRKGGRMLSRGMKAQLLETS